MDTALPIASNGHIANCLILTAAVIAETYTLPNALFADCMTMLPIAVIENCRPIG